MEELHESPGEAFDDDEIEPPVSGARAEACSSIVDEIGQLQRDVAPDTGRARRFGVTCNMSTERAGSRAATGRPGTVISTTHKPTSSAVRPSATTCRTSARSILDSSTRRRGRQSNAVLAPSSGPLQEGIRTSPTRRCCWRCHSCGRRRRCLRPTRSHRRGCRNRVAHTMVLTHRRSRRSWVADQ